MTTAGSTQDNSHDGAELRKLEGIGAHVVLEDADEVQEANQDPR